MAKIKVIARQSFDHSGSVKRGTMVMIEERVALQLADKGLVDIVRTMEDSKKKDYSSASPAVPVLAKKTASESKSGGKQKKKASKGASSSLTTHTK